MLPKIALFLALYAYKARRHPQSCNQGDVNRAVLTAKNPSNSLVISSSAYSVSQSVTHSVSWIVSESVYVKVFTLRCVRH